MPRIICLSDTHNCNEQIIVPDGDILIHAGDATIRGTQQEVEEFLAWFSGLPHQHKIFVAGNHDWLYETNNRFARLLTASFNIKYLQDSSTEIEGFKIYGSPWTPQFYDWAFMYRRGAPAKACWDLIPDGIDILITHGPPHGVLDCLPLVVKTGQQNFKPDDPAIGVPRLGNLDVGARAVEVDVLRTIPPGIANGR